ncbi:MAG: hypothetical protein ACE5EH_10110 [Gammaproteobacteria bacterium]
MTCKTLGIAIFCLCLYPVNTLAEQPVEGAFGILFGEKLDVSDLEQLDFDDKYGPEYAFTPSSPYKPLTKYSVFVSPISNQVYKIKATGQLKTKKKCLAELELLEQLLSRKYYKTSQKISKKFGDIPRISFGRLPRKAEGTCTSTIFKVTLTIRYYDKDLEKQARLETREFTNKTAAQPKPELGHDRDISGL